jgi:hypothetical protein
MLPLQDLPQATKDLLTLYRAFEDKLLASTAQELAQMNLQDAAAVEKLAEKLARDAEESLSAMARQQQETLRGIFENAVSQALEQDAAVYRQAGLAVPDLNSAAMQKIIKDELKTTQALVNSLANSTVSTLQSAVINAAEATGQLEAGSLDAPGAQREAISLLAQEGLRVTHAGSGKQERLEPALRRAAISGANKAALLAQWHLADEMNTDLVETSAHIGARNKGDVPENHEMWQGRVFSRSGKHAHYPDFVAITGFGTGAGLGGWNCRHSFTPFIEGVSRRRYSDEELAEMAERKVTYRGEEMSVYQATQVQRRLERELRSWERQANALHAAGLDNSAERAMMRQYQAELEKIDFQLLAQKASDRNTPLSKDELERVIRHVAEADFGSEKNVRVKEIFAGYNVEGHVLEKGEMTHNGIIHYVKHVLQEEYWPENTGYQQYIEDLKKVINDPNSGILWSKREDDVEQIAFWGKLTLREKVQNVVVIHRLGYDHWITGYCTKRPLEDFLAELGKVKWL